MKTRILVLFLLLIFLLVAVLLPVQGAETLPETAEIVNDILDQPQTTALEGADATAFTAVEKTEPLVGATSGTCGTNLTWSLNTSTGKLTISGTGAMTNYSSGAPWYSSRSSIKTVVIGSRVTSIGDYAFYNCSSLTSITIPGSVTSIGRYAFYYCTNLTSITIPDSVTSIGESAFRGRNLWNIDVATGNPAYTSLNGVLFNKEKTTLICCPGGKSGAYSIPDGVTSIGKYAFRSCTSLTSVTIPDSVTSIGGWAFSDCTSLTYNEYNNALYLGNAENPYHALIKAKDTSITTCVIHNNTRVIAGAAFYYYCTSLTSVTIPDSVTSIGESAFYNCSSLKTVFYCGTAEQWSAISIGSENSPLTNATRQQHRWNSGTITTAPNCTYDGVRTYTCTICGETKTEPIPKQPDQHVFVQQAGKAATCTAAGYSVKVCSVCAYVDYQDLPALGHKLTHHAAKAATCTAVGWGSYDDCSRCDYTTYAEIPALGHDPVHHDAKAPTCTAVGWNAYDDCSRCDYTTYAEIPALGHDPVHHDAKAPTCTAVGWNAYDTCSRCDYTTYKKINALGHNYKSAVTTAATCTADGVRTYTCTRDASHTYTEPIAALGHNLTHHAAKAASCTEIGWEAYDDCSRCDYTTYREIPALGHDMVWRNGVAATETEAGWAVYTCSRCGTNSYETIPATGAAKPGDMNGDDKINMKDVLTLRQSMAGGYGVTVDASFADLNHDGSVNMRDLLYLRQYLAGGYGIVLS